ncbi:molybdenum cofactor biosynthesis protein MoaB [Salinarchaeum chitinilyticum]
MVDFQSRDTRRSLGDDEGEAESDSESGAESDGQSDGATDPGAAAPANAEAAGDADAEAAPDADESGAPDGRVDEGPSNDHAHDHHADDLETVSAAILTVSSTRTIDEDAAGDAIVEVLEGAGHEIATRELVNDDYDGVQSAVDSLVSRGDVEAVVTTGGTGVSPDDVTPEAVRQLFEKPLPGFGETFRALSREEIGTRAIATRAMAGIADGVPVFCLPGSEAGARLGTAEIIEPEVGHLAGLSRPHETEE